VGIIDSVDVPYNPATTLTSEGPIDFYVPAAGDDYLDLAHTMLFLRVKITKSDGTALTATDNVAPVNNFMHSLFKNVEVSFNNKIINPGAGFYHLRSYIEACLNYGCDAKDSHLTSTLYYADTAGKFSDLDDTNTGFAKRKAFTSLSKEVDLYGKLNCDFFNQNRLLLNGVNMQIKLIRSQDSFCLMAAADSEYKVAILEAILFARRVKIAPELAIENEKTLLQTSAKYPIAHVNTKIFSLPKDTQSGSINNIFLGKLPRRIVLGFLSDAAFSGDYSKNGFEFKHFNLEQLALIRNGKSFPSKPFTPLFSKKLYVRSFLSIFSGLGIHFGNAGNCIKREDYPEGYCLFAFDLTPDKSAGNGSHVSLVTHGDIRVDYRFKTKLSETVCAVVYSEFDSMPEITHEREVYLDFGN
jgi:hypothetical protein